MHLRYLAPVALGTFSLACGLQVFELQPFEGESLAVPGPDGASADPATLHGSGAEPLSPVDPDGTFPTQPASNESPTNVIWPGDDRAPAAPVAPDAGAAPPGCSKLDFLFVIDNSLSMLGRQSNLVAGFPAFMRGVTEAVQASDHHIMVIDTDGWNGEGTQSSPGQCDDTLGAGKRSGAGGEDCGIQGPQRYIATEQPDLDGVFSCLGTVGAFGDFGEQPVDAMLRAVSDAENGPDGCNAGFSRPDAVLVVVLVTDEDDTRSAGQAEQWRQALIDAKGGDERAVVMLSFVGDDNVQGGLPGGPCPLLSISFGAPELQRFVQSMPLGSLASVCAEDYAPHLEQVVASIQSACEELSPPLR